VARENKIQGSVSLEVVVDETGTVTKVRVLKSKPKDYQPFVDAAVEAVRQWRYEPATKNGEPVGITMDVLIKFALS
jgi:protein TonB